MIGASPLSSLPVAGSYPSPNTSEYAAYFSSSIDSRIVPVGVEKEIFSTQNHATSTYVRNMACWAYGVDLTCISPWNDELEELKAGILISPRHIALANHYPLTAGTVVRFVTQNNVVVERTITGTPVRVGATDILIAYLDSDVPVSVSFAKVLPTGYRELIGRGLGIPVLFTDQEEKALVQDVWGFEWPYAGPYVGLRYPIDARRLDFSEEVITGDSGSPAMLLWGNQPVLITCFTSGLAGSGPDYALNRDGINAAMASFDSDYQLTPLNLSPVPVVSLSAVFTDAGAQLYFSADDGLNTYTFEVHRGADADFFPSGINRLAGKRNGSYLDTTGDEGVTYFYKVVAVNAFGVRTTSAAVSATKSTLPSFFHIPTGVWAK